MATPTRLPAHAWLSCCKSSELTPFTGELFMDLVEDAGFPPGVVSLMPGTADADNRLVTHPLVKKVNGANVVHLVFVLMSTRGRL
jgi:hypothetical protein